MFNRAGISICFLLPLAACVQRETIPAGGVVKTPAQASPPPVSGTAPAPAPAGKMPPAAGRLSDGGFKCAVSAIDPPSRMDGGAVIKVRLENQSPESWTAPQPGHSTDGMVALSYHWLDAGDKAVKEGGRALLPANLPPGGGVELDLTVEPPPGPGQFTLKIEPVQEVVAWFSEKGGCSQSLKVKSGD